MADPISLLCAALEAADPTLSPIGWLSIPKSQREILFAAGLVVAGPASELVRCPACTQAHFERVVSRPGPNGAANLFIRCPENLRVPITDEHRRCWRVNVEAVVDAIAGSLELKGGTRAICKDVLWHCGRFEQRGVRMDVYFARGLGNRDCATVAESLPRSVVLPLVLVPLSHPGGTPWREPTPTVFTLATVAALVEGRLVVDAGCVRQAWLKSARGDVSAAFIFRRVGDFWDVAFDGSEIKHIRDSVGMEYLARLLWEPHKHIGAATLLAARAGIDARQLSGSSGEALDEEGKRSLKSRYEAVMDRKTEAEKRNDQGALDAATAELDQLSIELNRRLGLGGRAREDSDADRVRKSVSMAVAREIEILSEKVPPAGQHLLASVSSGRFFKYSPEREIDWLL